MSVLIRNNQQQVRVNNEQRPQRASVQDGDDAVAGALEQAGSAAHQWAEKTREAHVQAEVVNAQLELRKRLDNTYRELSEDQTTDPEAFEGMLEKRSKEILGEVGGTVSSSRARQLWNQQAQGVVQAYTFQTRDLTRQRQTEGARAKTLSAIDNYGLIAEDPSQPREVLEQTHADVQSLIKSQRRAGLYTEDQEAELLIRTEAGLRSGISRRHLSNINDMIEGGRTGEAKAYFAANDHEISPGSREKVGPEIERATFVQRRQEATDDVFAQFGADGAAARRYIRENFEGDMEDAVLRDYSVRESERQISATQAKEAVLAQAAAAIEGGVSVDDLPPALYLALSEGERKWLVNRQQGVPTVTDYGAYNGYAEMSAADLKKVNLTEARSQLADSEYNRVEGWVRGARDGEQGVPESLRSFGQTLDDTLTAAGITDKKKAGAAKGELRLQVDEWSLRYQEENGRKPSDREVADEAQRLSTEYVLTRRDWNPFTGETSVRLYETDASINGVPEQHLTAVLSGLGGNGVEVGQGAVRQLYSDVMSEYSKRGISNPTPEQIRSGVEYMRAQGASDAN